MIESVQTELGTIPAHWKIEPLEKYCSRVSVGYVGPTSEYFTDDVGGIPLLRSQNIRDGHINRSNLALVTREFHDKNPKSRLRPGDVIVVRVGENRGDACLLPDIFPEVNCANVVFFRPDPRYGKFFELFLRSPIGRYNLRGMSTGSAQGVINTGSIAKMLVPIPPVHEATAIAEIIEALESKIDLLHRQNQTLEQMAETLYRQWFVEEDNGDWPTVKVKEVALLNPDSITKHYDYDVIEYLDTGSITAGVIDKYQIYDLSEAPSRAQRLVKADDIVYSLVRPAHRHYGILSSVQPNTVVSTGFCVLRSTTVSPYFLYLLLTQEDVVEYFHVLAEGSTSTYPSLRPDDVGSFEFALPPQDKMRPFSELCASAWKKIDANAKQIDALHQTRDTLLPKLMSGEICMGDRVVQKTLAVV